MFVVAFDDVVHRIDPINALSTGETRARVIGASAPPRPSQSHVHDRRNEATAERYAMLQRRYEDTEDGYGVAPMGEGISLANLGAFISPAPNPDLWRDDNRVPDWQMAGVPVPPSIERFGDARAFTPALFTAPQVEPTPVFPASEAWPPHPTSWPRHGSARMRAMDEDAPPSGPGIVEDLAKTVPTSLFKGAIGVLGAPGDLLELADQGGEALGRYVHGKIGTSPERLEELMALRRKVLDSTFFRFPTSRGIRERVESVTGPIYEPRTTAGRYVGTATEFVPGALLMPGGVVGNVVKWAIAPGIVIEATRDALDAAGW